MCFVLLHILFGSWSGFGGAKETKIPLILVFHSVQFSHSVMSNSLRPYELQHARPPCPSPTLRAYPNSCPLSWWCHPTISSSVVPFSSCPQSFPALGSYPVSQFLASGGQIIGASASYHYKALNKLYWFSSFFQGIISTLILPKYDLKILLSLKNLHLYFLCYP